MPRSAAHASKLCWACAVRVLDAAPSVRRPGGCSSATDWSDEPQAVRLSRRPSRKEYRDHYRGQTTIVDSTFTKLTTTEGDLKNNVRYTGRDQYTAIGDNVDTWYNNRARAL